MIVVKHTAETRKYNNELDAWQETGRYSAVDISRTQVKDIMEEIIYDLYFKEAGGTKACFICEIRNMIDDIEKRADIEEVYRAEISKYVKERM